MLLQSRPSFTSEDAVRILRQHYGIEGIAKELPSYDDQNFLIETGKERAFVLKIARRGMERSLLDLENQAMNHLSRWQDQDLVCPKVFQSVTGDFTVMVEGDHGYKHWVRLVSYLPGKPLARFHPHTPSLLRSLGRLFGRLDKRLAGFSHPDMRRYILWDLKNAGWIREHLQEIPHPDRRSLVAGLLDRFERQTLPLLSELRMSLIHNDGNDHNLLVRVGGGWSGRVVGIVDFGDIVYTHTVCETAIAAAYALLGKDDPLNAAAQVVCGYHQEYPLSDGELAVLFDLICIRLCISVISSAARREVEPDHDYLLISEAPAWAALERLAGIHPRFAQNTFRHACGLNPCSGSEAVIAWLRRNPGEIAPLVRPDPRSARLVVFDLSVASLELDDLETLQAGAGLSRRLFDRLVETCADLGVGRYNEARLLDEWGNFDPGWCTSQESPTIHLGMDLFAAENTDVYAPLDGTVRSIELGSADSAGGSATALLLEHSPEGGIRFFTRYLGLQSESVAGLQVGERVRKGDRIGEFRSLPKKGGILSHLHVQVIADEVEDAGGFPTFAPPGQREVWLSICPDPNLILNIPEAQFPSAGLRREEILAKRNEIMGRNLSLSYREPLKIVRGAGAYLYDENGLPYLDCVNNVCHVGHAHPRVVAAAWRQMGALNTNTRYLHDNLVNYAERLCGTLPDPLSVCFFVNSGSEANELALRMARTYTGGMDTLVLDGAYHGNTTSLIEISPYKFDGPGGEGAAPHVHVLPTPDPYRGRYRTAAHPSKDPTIVAGLYAKHVEDQIYVLLGRGGKLGAFIGESLMGCGGQILPPQGFFKRAYRHVRAAGGVCIADEVQVGFGRVGTHFWGFETHGVVPDIVTMGKPIGNGHPLGAVVTTPEIAESFANGMEYFNTFGGNPVSCAVGLAVLDVIEDGGLQENARVVGSYLRSELTRLAETFPLIGDVRGLGLFLGVELVADPESLAPAAAPAAYIVQRMRDNRILLSTDGPDHNVIKIKPPLVFSRQDADFLIARLETVLRENPAQPG